MIKLKVEIQCSVCERHESVELQFREVPAFAQALMEAGSAENQLKMVLSSQKPNGWDLATIPRTGDYGQERPEVTVSGARRYAEIKDSYVCPDCGIALALAVKALRRKQPLSTVDDALSSDFTREAPGILGDRAVYAGLPPVKSNRKFMRDQPGDSNE